MKKIFIVVAIIISYTSLYGQTVFDANTIGSTDINGTARYMGMAGAFGALGGNSSAIVDNPAGLGIYRKSELSATMNFQTQNAASNWNGLSMNGNKFGSNFSQISYVVASPTFRSEQNNSTGLLSSNWSFSYNQVKNFDRNVNIRGGKTQSSITDYMYDFTIKNTNYSDPYYYSNNSEYSNPYDNTNISWLSILAWDAIVNDTVGGSYVPFRNAGEYVSPSYQLNESGHINKYSLAWSGNYSNKFYLGVSLDYTAIKHRSTSTYYEGFENGDNINLMSDFSTTGSGVSLNIGTIIKPTDNFRLGFSFHSPTYYRLTDHSFSSLSSRIGINTHPTETPNDNYSDNTYHLISPLQLNASAAYLFDRKGALSVEYVYSNSTGMKLLDDKNNSTDNYTWENSDIANMLNNAHTIKIGAEINLTENIALRGGYALKTGSTKSDAVKFLNLNTTRTDTEFFINNSNTNYFTLGLGYHESSWFFDFAYVKKTYNEIFYPFDYTGISGTNAATIKNNTDNLVATLGFKF